MNVTLTNDEGRQFDITEHFRVMYDQLVSSMDWGSGFLDGGEALIVMQAGAAAGFEVDTTGTQVDSMAPFFPPYANDIKGVGETYESAYAKLQNQRDEWIKTYLGDPPTWESLQRYRDYLTERERQE